MVRGVTELSGLRETRTMHGSKKRSIPRVQSSAYLDLYMLGKEKDRLEKEMFIIEKRKTSLQKRLDDIAVEMKKLEGAETREKRAAPDESKKHAPKDWKTMAMTY
jgi:predicted  nucleic acid-binding Zn-ribbon protein